MPAPMIGLAAASLGSGLLQANAAKKNASAQAAAADQATALQREIFQQTTANYKPFLSAGKTGLAAYLYEMGLGEKPLVGGTMPKITQIGGVYKAGGQTFKTLAEAEAFQKENTKPGTPYEGYQQSPMAKYLMEEGVDSITGSAAAGGGLFSGASMEALEKNRRTVIGADTADYFSRLTGLANMGMGAAGNQASAGQNYANNAGNLAMQAGAAKGQGYMGAASAIGNTIGDMAGIYGYFGGQNNPMAAYAAPTMIAPRPQPNPYY